MFARGGACVTDEGYFDVWKSGGSTSSSEKLILNTFTNALDGERRSHSLVPESYLKEQAQLVRDKSLE